MPNLSCRSSPQCQRDLRSNKEIHLGLPRIAQHRRFVQFHLFTHTDFFSNPISKHIVPIYFSVFQNIEIYCNRLSHNDLLRKLAEMAIESVPRAILSPPNPVSIYIISNFMRPPNSVTSTGTLYPDVI